MEELPRSPIVFQCLQCYRIVGDSLGLVDADEELRTITLQGACNIVRSPTTRTSEDGKDSGSTFHELFCATCNTRLGRLYLTTAPHLDEIRNLFTFDTESLVSFELGRYDHTCEGKGGAAAPDQTAAAADPTALPGPTADAQSLPAEMVKLQGMLLLFHERISSLEKQLTAATGGGSRGCSGTEPHEDHQAVTGGIRQKGGGDSTEVNSSGKRRR